MLEKELTEANEAVAELEKLSGGQVETKEEDKKTSTNEADDSIIEELRNVILSDKQQIDQTKFNTTNEMEGKISKENYEKSLNDMKKFANFENNLQSNQTTNKLNQVHTQKDMSPNIKTVKHEHKAQMLSS